MCFGIITHRSTPQQLDIPDGDNGGFAEGSDAAEQQHSAQTVATTNRVHRGEAADQLDVHLPLRLPTGQLLLCLFQSVALMSLLVYAGLGKLQGKLKTPVLAMLAV